jgi:hypothetical protein
MCPALPWSTTFSTGICEDITTIKGDVLDKQYFDKNDAEQNAACIVTGSASSIGFTCSIQFIQNRFPEMFPEPVYQSLLRVCKMYDASSDAAAQDLHYRVMFDLWQKISMSGTYADAGFKDEAIDEAAKLGADQMYVRRYNMLFLWAGLLASTSILLTMM